MDSLKVPKSLTLIVLTYNEEVHLARCLHSCRFLSPDIFIVDSGSQDNTLKIALEYGASIYTHPFVNQAKQLIWALNNLPIRTEWILRLDADEYLSTALAHEISSVISFPQGCNGYLLPRRIVFNNTWIKHGGLFPTYILRLWRKNSASVVDTLMDEHVVLNSGRPRALNNFFTDHSLKDLTFWVQKHNGYSSREALKIDHEPTTRGLPILGHFSLKHFLKRFAHSRSALYIRPFLNFIGRYFFLGGFLDGKKGLVFHVMHSFWYRFLVDAKLDEASSISMASSDWCIACGDFAKRRRLRMPTLFRGGLFSVKICRTCGLGYTCPPPSISDKYYLAESNYAQTFSDSVSVTQYSARQISQIAFELDPELRYLSSSISAHPSALDVGCGSGAMLEVLQAANFNVHGIEANLHLCKLSSSRGLNVLCGDFFTILANMRVEGREFDLIVLSSVLEHVENPEALFKSCRELLKPNGRILVSQAFYRGLVPSLLPFLWYAWVPHEHYYHFTLTSISLIARNSGLDLLATRLSSLYHFPKSGQPFYYYPPKVIVFLVSKLALVFGRGDHLIALYCSAGYRVNDSL